MFGLACDSIVERRSAGGQGRVHTHLGENVVVSSSWICDNIELERNRWSLGLLIQSAIAK